MKKRYYKKIFAASACSMLIITSACFIEKITENTKHIAEGLVTLMKGSLGMGYSHANSQVPSTFGVDQVWAVPFKFQQGISMMDAKFFGYSTGSPQELEIYYKVFDVKKTLLGEIDFEIDVDAIKAQRVEDIQNNHPDWLFVLMNSGRVGSIDHSTVSMEDFPAFIDKRKDALVSFIGLSQSAGGNSRNTLLRIPVLNINDKSTVNFGAVDKNIDGSEAQSKKTIDENSASFSVTAEKMKDIATLSTLFKQMKNSFINKINCGISYYFNGSAHFDKLTQTVGRSPKEVPFEGSQLTFNYRTDQWPNFTSSTGNGILSLEVPDTMIRDPNGGFDETVNSQSFITYQSGERIPLFVDNTKNIIFEGKFINIFPGGWFKLWRESDQKVYGYYQLSMLNPFAGNSTDFTRVYMPVLSITADGAGKITNLSVDWYLYRESTGDYVKIETAEMLTMMYELLGTTAPVGGTSIQVGPGQYEDFAVVFMRSNIDAMNRHTVIFKMAAAADLTTDPESWYMPPQAGAEDPNKNYARLIKIEYNLAGFPFNFYWCKSCGSIP